MQPYSLALGVDTSAGSSAVDGPLSTDEQSGEAGPVDSTSRGCSSLRPRVFLLLAVAALAGLVVHYQANAESEGTDVGSAVGLGGSVGVPVNNGKPQWSSTCFGHVGAKACHTTNKCSCTSGCIGADGSCYSENNQVVADGFSLYNAKWPDYYLYFQSMSVFGQMKVSNSRFTMNEDKLTLLKPPGQGKEKEFFMASHLWPQSMVSLQPTGFTELSLWGTYSLNVKTDHEPWDLDKILLRICMPATFPNKTKNTRAVVFGLSKPQGGFHVWSYVAERHWLAQGYWEPEQIVSYVAKNPGKMPTAVPTGVPGFNGYWIPKPAFPTGVIPPC